MAIEYLDSGNTDGTSLGQSASSKAGMHGKAVAQAAAIATVGSVATSLKTTLNSVLTALRNKGIIAT